MNILVNLIYNISFLRLNLIGCSHYDNCDYKLIAGDQLNRFPDYCFVKEEN